MSATGVAPAIKRAEPMVKECFRNVFLHRPDPALSKSLSHYPQLVVVFPWVGAKEKYAHKFVDAWTSRGFNVLHVTTPVMDLVRPQSGTEVTSCKVADFLVESKEFNHVILHGISVGGYLGQRVLMALQGSQTLNTISHQIYDSFTQVAGFKSGVENGVNPRYKNIAKIAVKLYTQFADLKPLEAASSFVRTVPSHTPNLFIHSLSDKVAEFAHIENMLPTVGKNHPTYTILIPDHENIGHVSLFRKMGDISYMSMISRFLRAHDFHVLDETVLQEESADSDTAKKNMALLNRVQPLKD